MFQYGCSYLDQIVIFQPRHGAPRVDVSLYNDLEPAVVRALGIALVRHTDFKHNVVEFVRVFWLPGSKQMDQKTKINLNI